MLSNSSSICSGRHTKGRLNTGTRNLPVATRSRSSSIITISDMVLFSAVTASSHQLSDLPQQVHQLLVDILAETAEVLHAQRRAVGHQRVGERFAEALLPQILDMLFQIIEEILLVVRYALFMSIHRCCSGVIARRC